MGRLFFLLFFFFFFFANNHKPNTRAATITNPTPAPLQSQSPTHTATISIPKFLSTPTIHHKQITITHQPLKAPHTFTNLNKNTTKNINQEGKNERSTKEKEKTDMKNKETWRRKIVNRRKFTYLRWWFWCQWWLHNNSPLGLNILKIHWNTWLIGFNVKIHRKYKLNYKYSEIQAFPVKRQTFKRIFWPEKFLGSTLFIVYLEYANVRF